MNVLDVMDHAIRCVHQGASPEHAAWHAQLTEARAAVAELIEALRAYDRWNYEAQSARVNGESVYSFAELQEMREKASAMGYAALARVGAQ